MLRLQTRLASLALLIACSSTGRAQPAASSGKPRLVVLIAIDQFRADYLERFGALPGGLGRLSRGGAWFTNAHHDHAITETAPGHATLLSGRFPRSTGIMLNRIGVEDGGAPLIAGGLGTGASPRRFQGTTLVDWIRSADPQSRAFSVSSKDRAAILPVGRSKSEVYWYSPDGRFTTSSYYRDTLPSWVVLWNNRNFPQTFAGKRWDLLLPASAYPESDSVEAEGGRQFTFPHDLPSDPEAAANIVRATPFIDDITLSFALHGVQSLALGADAHTDVLSISLSATDYIGHRYGPDSREIHDQVVRLDRKLGVFLDSLYRLRDSSQITIALSADHGVGTIPEIAPASVMPRPVRVSLVPLIAPLRAGLLAARVDTLAIDVDQQIVLADRAAFARVNVNADSAIGAFAAAIRALPGVRRVDRFQALAADTLTDPIARRWRHQFPASSVIELVVTLTPGSTWAGNIAFHGTPYDYDSHVPIVFYGAGVRPGRYPEFVRTVDLAPTLAVLAGVRPTEPLDGVPLVAAIH
ncbi:alkaline phosphatase family protein [soil metagenome]